MMFRTARAFLLAAPPAFAVALLAFLLAHPRAVESFTVYPFLQNAVGQALARRPVGRFVATSTVFFLFPYLVTGLLLLFADFGIASAARLWSSRGATTPVRRVPPRESAVAFAAAVLLVSAVAGASLHRVAHGGELPGGVNVAPIFVAAIPFAAVLSGLVAAGLASLPRAVWTRFFAPGRAAREAA